MPVLRSRGAFLFAIAILFAGCNDGATIGPSVVPRATATPNVTATPVMAATPSAPPSPGTSPAASPTPHSTPISVPVNPQPTGSIDPSATPVPTPTPTTTPVPTATPAATATPTATGTPVAMPTTTPTPTAATATPADAKLYVSNHGTFGTMATDSPSVTVYPVTASGNATPIATLKGPATQLSQTQFVAVDSRGRTYVSNQTTAGDSSVTYGTVTEYDNLQGNVAPVITLRMVRRPEGLAIDANDNLHLVTGNAVYVLPRGATDLAQATTTIAGNQTHVLDDYGAFVEPSGKFDLAGSNQLVAFAPGASGNAVPVQYITGTATMLASALGIAADAAGTLYATNYDANTIVAFASTATTTSANSSSSPPMGPTPQHVYASTLFNKPWGIFIDPAGAFYVANVGNSSVLIFSSATTLASGVTTQSISGSATGLNNPIGVYVR